MKFCVSFIFAHFISAHPHFFHFRATAKKVWCYQTKTSQMLVFCWYLVRERKKNPNMSFKNRAIFHSNSRGLYIRAEALRENKTHAKIS